MGPSDPAKKTAGRRRTIEQLEAQVDALREQLRHAQRLAAVGTMTAMVIHEFNNILSPVISYACLARENPAMTGKAIHLAANGGQRAKGISEAILDMFRGESAPPVELNFPQLVSQTLTAMARDPQRDSIEVALNAPADLTVRARRVELQQVLLNLILNARKAVLARSAPRRIDISAEHGNGSVTIRVADNGVGIAPGDIEKIFDPFFRADGGEDGEPQGCGLGLALCHQIVTCMGGSISVDSAPGEGSTFLLRLPR